LKFVDLEPEKRRVFQTPNQDHFRPLMTKALDRWLLPWMQQRLTRSPRPVSDLILAVCDHFEPFHHTDKAGALRRMRLWHEKLPALSAVARDHNGQGPKHTFFYPIEQYDPEVLDSIAELCRITGNEVEVHLHHENDTAENLVRTLEKGKVDLRRHGLLGADADGAVAFGFIHGNWALDDSDPSGHGCGVRDELAILKQAGCYADLTMPSAPHPTQVPMVNSLYYSRSTPNGCSHHRGRLVAAGPDGTQGLRSSPDHLLLVQGPLTLDFQRRKWGVMPRVENADLGPQNPPTLHRMRQWLKCGVSVQGAEGWCFVKLHTHGAPEHGHPSNLGPARLRFHAQIEEFALSQGLRLHYVSAREMVNIVHAAEDGHMGDAGVWRDHVYSPPPVSQR
jgi:hypothetical protein